MIEVPTGPDELLRLVMLGTTANAAPVLAFPPTVTTTLPLVAPLGTGTVMAASVQLVGVANAPLKVTVLVPWVVPKPEPPTLMEVPTVPEDGVRLLIFGITVKFTALLASPPTVTTTGPVSAPGPAMVGPGTATMMLVALQVMTLPAIPLKVTKLLPWVAPKLAPVIVTEDPTKPEVGERLVMLGVMLKGTELLTKLPTTRNTLPVVAPAGTGTTMLVLLQLVGLPRAPLKSTVLVPCVDPKPVPLIVIEVPTEPAAGLTLVIVGATVKGTLLLVTPFTVTTTLPVLAFAGTDTVIPDCPQAVGVAATPLNVTVLAPWAKPKPVPEIDTEVPGAPDVGFRLEITGVTVKLTPLLGIPLTCTVTLPVVAAAGTVATTLVGLQLVMLAQAPLKETTSPPEGAPKFVPVIVTEVPTTPEVGFKLVMFGGGVTVKSTPLLAIPPTFTTTFPVAAPVGTGTVMLVSLQVGLMASVPLKVTVLVD